MTPVSLHALLDAVRRHLRIRLVLTLALASCTLAQVVLVFAWILAGPEGWRPGTTLPLLLLLGGVAGLLGLGAWTAWTLDRWTAEESLASEIERTTRLPEGAVLAQAELNRALPPGVSESLARAGESALVGQIGVETGGLVGEPGRRASRFVRASGVGLALGLGIVFLLFLAAPDRARAAWAGLAHPRELLARPPLPPLELRPGDARLPRGEEPLVEVVAEGRDSVTVHWRAIGEVEEARTLGVSRSVASLTLPPLETDVSYWASSPDGARTETRTLTPSDPSLLADLLVELTYPGHTRLPPASIRGAPEALAVPEGTILRFTGGMQGGAAVTVSLRDEQTDVTVLLPIEDGRFAGDLTASRSALLEWVVEGGVEGGLLPPPLDLEVIPDEAPTLTFPEPGTGGELPLSLRLPLELEAVDDYGVSWIEIETRLRDVEGVEVEGGSVDRIPTADRQSVILHPTLDFTQWAIRPGEQVVVRARVADNAPSPHMAESATYVLRMPQESELRDIARGRLEEVAARAQELLDRTRQEEQELRDLERRTRLGQDQPGGADVAGAPVEEVQDVQQAVERQVEVARDIQALQGQLTEAVRSLGDQDETDLELAERIEELARMLEEVLGAGAVEQLEELLDALQSEELSDELAQAAGDLSARQQEMRSRLEQMVDRLRRSVLEEAMRGAEEELRTLSDTQDALVDSLSMGQGIEQQQDLARRAEELEQQLDQIADDLRDQAEPEVAEQTDQASQDIGQARDAMQQGIEETAQGDTQAAGDRAAEAAEALAGALDMMEEARTGMTEEWNLELQEGLRRGAQDALTLARRQEDLGNELPSAGPARGAEFQGEETALRDGLRNLANQLAQATVQAPDIGRDLSDAVGRAIAETEQALETLRGSGRAAVAQSEQAVASAERAMNEIALRALAALSQSAQAGQAGATENQIRSELENLAAAQESVNRGSSSLGQDPGQDGATARMEQLANAQEIIAGRLGELARRPGAGRAPGNFEALSEEARQIAEELRNQRLDGTTFERQGRFLELLLSAGRTLERDEPTEEREARGLGVFERRLVSPIPEYLLEARAIQLPTAQELEALTPAQRRLVLEYFERVNSRRARGDGQP